MRKDPLLHVQGLGHLGCKVETRLRSTVLEVRDTVELGRASRGSTGFGAMEEGLISS